MSGLPAGLGDKEELSSPQRHMSFSINVISILCTKDSRVDVFSPRIFYLPFSPLFAYAGWSAGVRGTACGCGCGVLVRFTHELLLTNQDFAALPDA